MQYFFFKKGNNSLKSFLEPLGQFQQNLAKVYLDLLGCRKIQFEQVKEYDIYSLLKKDDVVHLLTNLIV